MVKVVRDKKIKEISFKELKLFDIEAKIDKTHAKTKIELMLVIDKGDNWFKATSLSEYLQQKILDKINFKESDING